MPTENEVKYVLNIGCEHALNEYEFKKYSLNQGYLVFAKGMTLRLRSSQEIIEDFLDKKVKRKICYKQKVGSRVIELEKKINKRDFSDLWDICLNKVNKIRYELKFNGYLWEIDFFKNHFNETYFVVAEHEMPEGQKSPLEIPEFVLENTIHEVGPDEDQFSTKRLACVNHAKKLYNSIFNEETIKI